MVRQYSDCSDGGGRFVDFKEPIDTHSDAQIGAAVGIFTGTGAI